MRWSSRRIRRAALVVGFCVAVLFAFVLGVSGFADEKRLSVYSSSANYSLTVTEKNGTDYVGLFEILQPLGTVNSRSDGRVWRLNFNHVESEFAPGKSRARIRGQGFRSFHELPAGKRTRTSPAEFPAHSDAALSGHAGQFSRELAATVYRKFSRTLHRPGEQDEPSDPGDELHLSGEPHDRHRAGKTANGVYPRGAGPSGSQTLTFDNPAIPSAVFQENNGAVEIAVNGQVPLFASFSNDGRTITITPTSQTPAFAEPAFDQTRWRRIRLRRIQSHAAYDSSGDFGATGAVRNRGVRSRAES